MKVGDSEHSAALDVRAKEIAKRYPNHIPALDALAEANAERQARDQEEFAARQAKVLRQHEQKIQPPEEEPHE